MPKGRTDMESMRRMIAESDSKAATDCTRTLPLAAVVGSDHGSPQKKHHKEKKHKKSHKHKKEKKLKKDRKRDGQRSDTSNTSGSDHFDEFERHHDHPLVFIMEQLEKVAPEGKQPRLFPSLQMYGVFEEWTDAQKKAYDKDAIMAIRGRDLDTLKRWHSEGRILQAANVFGESLLHMACRRGFLDIVQFLVVEAGHSIWIRDDAGRTPLHDACWTTTPNSGLISFFIERDPDMLFVSDKRGHTPLDYARREHFPHWVQYFKSTKIKKLLPKRDLFYVETSAVMSNSSTANLEAITMTLNDVDLNRES
eukprot:CAMPEP_0202449492 /NCGR_PEP_ID=MMETSP1360-20130828/8211_1 /ASSEMBLY_ACC=CAM_ASM_000848 /TAXON_ID=515479 /ORGANISM="Licmophora paradoxa, Strain CCMP2313" /LENGTH=307 /DNA_ID=CAMNT_0049067431 /DNA_START=79 /DNA_END=1002 /DNA_ORIENTATION=-